MILYACDSCGAETTGWSKRDLLGEGWRWHDGKRGREVVVCGECAVRHAERREAAAEAGQAG